MYIRTHMHGRMVMTYMYMYIHIHCVESEVKVHPLQDGKDYYVLTLHVNSEISEIFGEISQPPPHNYVHMHRLHCPSKYLLCALCSLVSRLSPLASNYCECEFKGHAITVCKGGGGAGNEARHCVQSHIFLSL